MTSATSRYLWRFTGRSRAYDQPDEAKAAQENQATSDEKSRRAQENKTTGEVNLAEYDSRRIEAKWQKVWEEQGAFHAEDGDGARAKYYLLEMLPYPSGILHMGHMRNYTIGDAVARYKRVDAATSRCIPWGWDAFRAAGRKRGNQERHSSSRLDKPEHRGVSPRTEAFRFQLRLAA